MTIWLILFIAVYLSVLIAYFFSETSGNHKRRAVNKIALASLYLLYAFYAFLTGYPFWCVHLVGMVAILFSWFGDVLLLYSFFKGGIAFSIGNAVFVAYEILLFVRYGIPFARVWWAIPLFFIVWGTVHALVMKGWFNGKHVKAYGRYFASAAAHGSLGIAMAAASSGNVRLLLLGLGLPLFMISDIFLGLHKFKYRESKAILRCNSGTYFVGLLLVVLSLSAIV